MVRYATLLWTFAALVGCAAASPVAIIPVTIVQGNAVTSARIGDEQLDLVVDTGGLGGIAISPEDLGRLKVTFTGESIERTDAAGDIFKSREFVVPELTLGGHRFFNVNGFERIGSASGFAGGSPINVLGRGMLHEFTVVVDYPNAEVRLYSPKQATGVCGKSTIDLIETDDGMLALFIGTDDGQMLALMDTGATFSFVQTGVVASRNLKVVDDLYTTNTLQIGIRDLGPLEMVALPINGAPSIDALIGANFFSKYTVCIDYSRRKLSVLT